jgi:subfamily B ATP-binding cassette protein MsbA
MSPISKRLLAYLRPYVWPYFLGGMICMVLFGATNGVMPFLVRYIFDDIFGRKDIAMLHLLPAMVIGTFVARGFFAYGSLYLSEYVANRIVTDMRNQLNAHIQNLSLSFFNRNSTGAIVSRVANDVFVVGTTLTNTVASAVRDSVSLLSLVVVAFVQDWMLALIAFVAFPASVIPVLRLSKRLRSFSRKRQVSLGLLSALLQETVQGNRVVKAFGMEAYEVRRFAGESERLFGLAMKVARIRAFTAPMMEILAAFGIAGVVFYGGNSVVSGGRTQGSFFAFLTALFLLYDPFKKLGRANGLLQQGLAAAERVFEFLDIRSEVVERPGAEVLAAVRRGVEFDAVSFRYDAEPVLRDVTLSIGRGEVLALVGPSGGGKSTLADLLLRFYDVTEGAIRVDGTDIRDLTLASLRAQIALVTQHTFLFNDTVRNNIA